jgi:hypothetical protein
MMLRPVVMSKRPIGIAAVLILSCLSLCCGGRNFRVTNAAEMPSAPASIELRSEHSFGTLHFPPGIYVLNAVDDAGYYYRAPRKIVQRSFSGVVKHDGGIFVSKRDSRKLRGYVIMPSGLTHVGNLSQADYTYTH